MKNLGAWQLMLVSALAVPVIALGIIYAIRLNAIQNEAALKFIALNQKQLKTYGLGVILLIAIIGGLIMVAAAIWGVLINAFLLMTAFSKRAS